MNVTSGSRWLPLAVACCVAFGVSACSTQAISAQAPVRVMIGFRAPVDGASPDLLSSLAQRSGASVRFAASVSPKLHAFVLSCPESDPDCTVAIGKLRADPAIEYVSVDRLRGPIQEKPQP